VQDISGAGATHTPSWSPPAAEKADVEEEMMVEILEEEVVEKPKLAPTEPTRYF